MTPLALASIKIKIVAPQKENIMNTSRTGVRGGELKKWAPGFLVESIVLVHQCGVHAFCHRNWFFCGNVT